MGGMFGRGMIGMLSIVSGLLLAIPMAIVGFEFLAQGRPVFGIVFLGLAFGLVWLPEYVLKQLPGPRAWLRDRLPWRSADGSEGPD